MNGIDPNPGLSQKLCYGTRRRVQIPLTSDQAATDPVCVCGCPVSRDGPRWTYIEQVSNRISHSKTAAHNASIIRRSNRTVSYVNTSNVIRPSPRHCQHACQSFFLFGDCSRVVLLNLTAATARRPHRLRPESTYYLQSSSSYSATHAYPSE